jgi:hypothetical protein
MNYHNPSLRDLNSAVRVMREKEAEAKQDLIVKIKDMRMKRQSDDEILTYMVKYTGLDLYNAKRFLQYNF